MRKDQLYRMNGLEFYEWLFGPEKFSGFSRNGPLIEGTKRIFTFMERGGGDNIHEGRMLPCI